MVVEKAKTKQQTVVNWQHLYERNQQREVMAVNSPNALLNAKCPLHARPCAKKK